MCLTKEKNSRFRMYNKMPNKTDRALYCSGFSSSKFRSDGETELAPRSRTRMFGENERKYCDLSVKTLK